MQKMLVCGVLAAMVACGGGQKQAEPEKPQPPIENKVPPEPAAPKSETQLAMDAMRSFRDQLCACRDADCTRKVADDMTKWGQAMSKKYSEAPPKMSEAEQKEMQQVGTEMGECMSKAMGASPPPNTGNNPCGGGP